MSLRTIAFLSAAAVLLFGAGAITASATMVVAGLSIGLLASLAVSIKTDDPSRSMQELLLEQPADDGVVEVLSEEPVSV